ncbi:MAG: cytochrome, partial [Variovorax sp.]|nr:cytochrome [Variovorax sp.]
MSDTTATFADPGLRLFTAGASSVAPHTDRLFTAMLLLCGGMALLLAFLVVWMCVRYRRGSSADRTDPPSDASGLEVAWTIAPLLLFLGIFAWAARDYLVERRAPANALQIDVVGKQWMWKLQHPGGQREINQLHVPVGRPVRLTMSSQDVIHSFGVPAFRIKQDVLPGSYTTQWFTATKAGTYDLFCQEYCGT